MKTSFNRGVAAALSLAMFCTGCMKTRVAMVGRCENQVAEASQPVRYSGEYTAKWTDSDRNHLHTIAGTSRFAHTGEKLGFTRVDGELLALHGDERVPLGHVPKRAKYVVWYNQQTVQTQFGREMDKSGAAMEKIAGAAIIGGLILWAGYEVYQHPEVLFSSDTCDNP
ncbi:hypothetical protein BH10PLA1_BH10PLA1_12400 [soil metagenome]